MTKIFIAVLSISMFLLSCSNDSIQNNNVLTKDTLPIVNNSKQVDTSKDISYLKFEGDSVVLLPFEIEVNLSPKAEQKITMDKETIIVHVFLNGTPKDSSHANLEENGSFFVASAQKEILYGQIARFDSIKFSKLIYNQLANKDAELSINVYSGRKSSQNNLLNCDPLFDKTSNVVGKIITLRGKLIYGDD